MKGAAIVFFCALALAHGKTISRSEEEADSDSSTWPDSADCKDWVNVTITVSKGEDFLIPHENCNQYYSCHDEFESGIAMFCFPGLVFNYRKQYCDWPKNVDCGNRPIAEFEGLIPEHDYVTEGYGHSDPSLAPAICAADNSDGVLIANENCNQFYKCAHGSPVAMGCPFSLYYNPSIETCDWPENVDCGDRIP